MKQFLLNWSDTKPFQDGFSLVNLYDGATIVMGDEIILFHPEKNIGVIGVRRNSDEPYVCSVLSREDFEKSLSAKGLTYVIPDFGRNHHVEPTVHDFEHSATEDVYRQVGVSFGADT